MTQRHAHEQATRSARDGIRAALRPVALAVAGALAGCGAAAITPVQRPASQPAQTVKQEPVEPECHADAVIFIITKKIPDTHLILDDGQPFYRDCDGADQLVDRIRPLVKSVYERVMKRHRYLHETELELWVDLVVNPDGHVKKVAFDVPDKNTPDELLERLADLFASVRFAPSQDYSVVQVPLILRPEGLSAWTP